jgi:alkylated DNA repair dioxygenase AlkB
MANVSEEHVVLDTKLLKNVLPPDLAGDDTERNSVFETVLREVEWHEMQHKGGAVPRLVSLQGDKTAKHEPLYRHPADVQPPLTAWTPTIEKLRDHCSSILQQPLNHALIQWYRSGDDYISEHADKTIDVERGSSIVNLSLGATRTMVLRPKRESAQGKTPTPRPAVRCRLQHGSLFVLGWETNRTMTHEIKRDKRETQFKTADELDYGGMRISITFRYIATFLTRDGQLFGQGARGDAEKHDNVLSEEAEAEALLRAFSN